MALRLFRHLGRRALARFQRLHHPPHQLNEDQKDEICPICQDSFNDPACLPCLHVCCHACLNGYATQRQVSLGELVVYQALGIIIIPCPMCRLITHKKRAETMRFPEPRKCDDCGESIKRAVKFPKCGHFNDNRCVRCMEASEAEGEVRCPKCLIGSLQDINKLDAAYLCSTCEEFKGDKTCTDCLKKMVHPPRNAAETRKDIQTECTASTIVIFAIIALVLGALYWSGESHNRIPPVRQQYPTQRVYDENCYHGSIWYVNTRGQADNVVCDGWPRATDANLRHRYPKRHTRKKTVGGTVKNPNTPTNTPDTTGQTKEELRKKWNDQNRNKKTDKLKKEEKLEAIYQKDCYPRRVWEVSPEGEVYTKRCEEVIVGHRKVFV